MYQARFHGYTGADTHSRSEDGRIRSILVYSSFGATLDCFAIDPGARLPLCRITLSLYLSGAPAIFFIFCCLSLDSCELFAQGITGTPFVACLVSPVYH